MFSRPNDLKKLATPKALTVPPLGGIDQYTVLYMDGKTVTDTSLYSKVVTNNGVSVSTTQSKFGGSSLYFNGSGYLTIANSDDYDFLTGAFNVEWWEYKTVKTNGAGVICRSGVTYPAYMFGYHDATAIEQVYINSNETSWDICNGLALSNTTDLNAWYHNCICRSGNSIYIFRNGNLMSTTTSSASIYNSSSVLYIGRYLTTNWNGYINGLKIDKGICRRTANFTPPDRPYTVLN